VSDHAQTPVSLSTVRASRLALQSLVVATDRVLAPDASRPARLQQIVLIDPRGARFGAAVTSTVLATVLLTGLSTPGLVLLAAQAVAFALAAFSAGLRAAPAGIVFRSLIRPRLTPPDRDTLEPDAAPRFAQLVGLTFAVVGLALGLAGLTSAALVAVGGAFAAALLNATTGICLGCEVHLRLVARTGRSFVVPTLVGRAG
jgi:hypothetical protein